MKFKIVSRGETINAFNPENGMSLSIGSGKQITPSLLDVSLTSKCEMNCPYCYKKTNADGYDMTMEDFAILIERMEQAKIFQVAYGGGNPNEHKHFSSILKMTKEAGIVPNYSTNGDNLNDEIITTTAKYCGAMAVSIHKNLSSYRFLIPRLTDKIDKVNLHFVMLRSECNELIGFLSRPPEWAEKVNAVILLRYKDSSSCSEEEPTMDQYRKLFAAAEKSPFRIGFDTCSFFLIKRFLPKVDHSSFDFCESGRSSAYVDEHLIMSPCSFDKSHDDSCDLHKRTIEDIFSNSPAFINRRIVLAKWHSCNCFSFSNTDLRLDTSTAD